MTTFGSGTFGAGTFGNPGTFVAKTGGASTGMRGGGPDQQVLARTGGGSVSTMGGGGAPVLTVPPVNLVTGTDADFETSLGAWFVSGTVGFPAGSRTFIRDTVSPISGVASAHLTGTNTGTTGQSVGGNVPGVPVTPGLPYSFQVEADLIQNPGGVTMTLVWRNSGGAQVGSTLNSTPVSTTGRTTLKFENQVAPVGAVAAQFGPQLRSDVNGQTVEMRYDDALATQAVSTAPLAIGKTVTAAKSGGGVTVRAGGGVGGGGLSRAGGAVTTMRGGGARAVAGAKAGGAQIAAGPGFAAAYAATVAGTSGVAAHYRLNEVSGDAASSVNGLTAAYVAGTGNAPTYRATGLLFGDTDRAVSFPGSTGVAPSYFRQPYNATYFASPAASLEAWVKMSAALPLALILGRSSPNIVMFVEVTTGLALRFYVRDSNLSDVTVGTSVSLVVGQTHHIVCTYDHTIPEMKVYVDGVDQTTGASRAPNAPLRVTTGSGPTIGSDGSANAAQFPGTIDEAAWYTRALSASEVTAHYAAGTGIGAVAAGMGTKAASVAKAGGAVRPLAGGATRVLSSAKAGGATLVAGGGGTRTLAAAKVGGGSTVRLGGGTLGSGTLSSRDGGAVTTMRGGGAKAASLARTGGAATALTGGAARAISVAKASGAVTTARGGGSRTTPAAKAGGAVLVAGSGGAKTTPATKAGGAVIGAGAGGARAASVSKASGAATALAGGGQRTLSSLKAGGARTAQAGGATRTTPAVKAGGGRTAVAGGGSAALASVYARTGGAVTVRRGGSGFSPSTTRPVGSPTLSDAAAFARVRPASENIPGNVAANHYTPTAGELANFYALSTEPYSALVTGGASGTTDELIQWAAWKWGVDEEVLRAVSYQESEWIQATLGDRRTETLAAYNANPPQAQILASVTATTGDVWQSLGLTQVKWLPEFLGSFSGWDGTEPLRWKSTAFNLDFWGRSLRSAYDGLEDWLLTEPNSSGSRNQDYAAGDLWGCVGFWFSGDWYSTGSQNYIALVQGHMTTRPWPTVTYGGGTGKAVSVAKAAGARSALAGGATRTARAAKSGGAQVGLAGGGTEVTAALLIKAGGAVVTMRGGGTQGGGQVIGATGGGRTAMSGAATRTVAVSKASGATTARAAGGTKTITTARAGGGVLVAGGGASRTLPAAKAGGGRTVMAGGGTKVLARGGPGGARIVGGAGATRSVISTKAGGATLSPAGGAGRSVGVVKAGGARTIMVGGGGTQSGNTFSRGGGASLTMRAGAQRASLRVASGGARLTMGGGATSMWNMLKTGGATTPLGGGATRTTSVTKAGGARLGPSGGAGVAGTAGRTGGGRVTLGGGGQLSRTGGARLVLGGGAATTSATTRSGGATTTLTGGAAARTTLSFTAGARVTMRGGSTVKADFPITFTADLYVTVLSGRYTARVLSPATQVRMVPLVTHARILWPQDAGETMSDATNAEVL